MIWYPLVNIEKTSRNDGKSPFYSWENQRFLWATFNNIKVFVITRGYFLVKHEQPQSLQLAQCSGQNPTLPPDTWHVQLKSPRNVLVSPPIWKTQTIIYFTATKNITHIPDVPLDNHMLRSPNELRILSHGLKLQSVFSRQKMPHIGANSPIFGSERTATTSSKPEIGSLNHLAVKVHMFSAKLTWRKTIYKWPENGKNCDVQRFSSSLC